MAFRKPYSLRWLEALLWVVLFILCSYLLCEWHVGRWIRHICRQYHDNKKATRTMVAATNYL